MVRRRAGCGDVPAVSPDLRRVCPGNQRAVSNLSFCPAVEEIRCLFKFRLSLHNKSLQKEGCLLRPKSLPSLWGNATKTSQSLKSIIFHAISQLIIDVIDLRCVNGIFHFHTPCCGCTTTSLVINNALSLIPFKGPFKGKCMYLRLIAIKITLHLK